MTLKDLTKRQKRIYLAIVRYRMAKDVAAEWVGFGCTVEDIDAELPAINACVSWREWPAPNPDQLSLFK